MKIETSKIKLSNGAEIVSERYNYDNEHAEIAVCLWKDGVIMQNLCVIRPYEDNKENVEILVWADECDEDYTHRFVIKQYEEEE